jgi:ATP-binding protein involved in chromosome partitioning
MATDPGSEAGKAFAEIARVIDEEMAPTRRSHPELKLL